MENKTWIEELRKEQIKNSARNPGHAAMMSFFVMGLGQIYAGHVDRGIFLLAIHIGGVFSGLSLYFKGMLYQTLIPMVGLEVMMVFIYVISVILILLWIYNIKDAYHLSLFSSYRDWFEVERVLIPVLDNHTNKLLEHNTNPTHEIILDEETSTEKTLIEDKKRASRMVANKKDKKKIDESQEIEETEVIITEHESETESKTKSGSEAKIVDDIEDDENFPENNSGGRVIYFSDIDYAMQSPKQSWKIYVGVLLILLLVGTWFKKENHKKAMFNSSSFFSISAELPTTVSIKRRKANVNSNQPVSISDNRLTKDYFATQITAKNSSPTANSILEEGLYLLTNGDDSQATEKFKIALQKAKPSKEVWKKILGSFYRVENKIEYENYLNIYLKDFPKDFEEWQNLGKLLYDRKHYAKACKAFITALDIKPKSVRANFLLGSIYNDLKLYNDASKHFETALEADPLNIEINRGMAISLSETNQKERALEHINRILTIQPDDEDALKQLARIKADASLSQSKTTELGDQKGIIFVQGKKVPVLITKDAKRNYQEPSTVLPTYNKAFPGVEIINATASTSKLIKESLTELLYESSTKRPIISVAQTINKVDKEINKPTVATAQSKNKTSPKLEEKIKLNKNAGISALELTNKLQIDTNKPLRDSVAIESGANQEQNLNNLLEQGFNKYSLGKLEESLAFYLKYLEKRKDANAYDMVGIIFYKLDMKKDAFEASKHAYQMGSKSFSTLSRLGNLAIKINRYKDAESYLYSALQIKPNRVDTRILYARALAINGKKQKAISELNDLMEKRRDSYSIRQKVKSEISNISISN